jgi:hypothetical protein
MSRGFPSMTALLGLLAVAGYQHRDKVCSRRSKLSCAVISRMAYAITRSPASGSNPYWEHI